MNPIVQTLLSGLVGAVVGALLYAFIAWQGIKREVDVMISLQKRTQLEQGLAALGALREELRHNEALSKEAYKEYLPFVLSVGIWRTMLDKVGWTRADRLRDITGAYLAISAVIACAESIRHFQRSRLLTGVPRDIEPRWMEMQKASPNALSSLEAEMDAARSELQRIGLKSSALGALWHRVLAKVRGEFS
jgi:hypothetical protein